MSDPAQDEYLGYWMAEDGEHKVYGHQEGDDPPTVTRIVPERDAAPIPLDGRFLCAFYDAWHSQRAAQRRQARAAELLRVCRERRST